jgi:acetylglutamate kinase
MQPGDVVVRFLESVGRRSEAELYLRLFRAENPESFAILVVDEEVMRPDDVDAFAVDLRCLVRLGLRPVIALGAEGGGRPVSAHLRELAEWLDDAVSCSVVDTPEQARTAARAGKLPLVVCGDRTDVASDRCLDTLADLAAALRTRKIVFLGRRSGLEPRGAPMPSLVDIATEYEPLMADGVLPSDQRAILRQARRLLDHVAHPMTIAVTSPLELLRELFTVRGAGTLIRRAAAIERHATYATVDLARLAAVMEWAFGAVPVPAFLGRPVTTIYIAGDYDGAAIVAPTALAPYLTKFAVDGRARGEGIGRDLWRALTADHPRLFWRSRDANPINSWYIQQCDGTARIDPGWWAFWRNLEPHEIAPAIELARAAPRDFPDRPTG